MGHPENSKSIVDMCLSPKGDFMVLYQNFEIQNQNEPPNEYSNINLWDINNKVIVKTLISNPITDFISWRYFPDGIKIGISTSSKFKIVNVNSLDTVIINNSVNEFAVSKGQEVFYLGFMNSDVGALNYINYEILCASKLEDNTIATFLILSIDENYYIIARGGKLLKVKNCLNTSSIDENVKILTPIIYPNPGTDSFIIHNNQIPDKTYPAEVTNNSGVFIIKKSISFINGQGSFSAVDLPSGTYFLRLITPTESYTYKFVVVR